MRVVDIDFDRIVHRVRTHASQYASWVWASENDIPLSLTVSAKADRTLAVRLEYANTPTKSVPTGTLGKSNVYHYNHSRLAGFDIPMKGFKSELGDLVARLEDAAKLLNDEPSRLNYRLAASFLREYADELFLPGQ